MSNINCPNCNEEFSRNTNPYDTKFVEKNGACKKCFLLSKGLVKAGNAPYYVPWGYRNWVETEEPRSEESFEDINMFIPTISWCDRYNKWKLTTSGADSGGYDVSDFEIYFDTKEEIVALMLKGDE